MRVISKVHLFCINLLVSGAAIAGDMGVVVNSNPYNGLYVGGNIGVANLLDKESTTTPLYARHQLSSTGVIGGGVVGYDLTVRNNLKLGLEGFANATGLNVFTTQSYAPIARYNAKMQYNAGFRLLPGYAFSSNTVGHVILGYSYGQFKIRDNGDYGIVNSHFSKSGFQPGLGIQTALTQNVFIRGDLIYTAYSSQTSSGVLVTSGSQTYYNHFATMEGDLALVYKFA